MMKLARPILSAISIFLAAAWLFFIVAGYSTYDKGVLGAIFSVLIVTAGVGVLPQAPRPALTFMGGFGILLTAVGVGYYLGLFFLPAIALCWLAGMLAAFDVQMAHAARLRLRFLGWGLLAAASVYVGLWAYRLQTGFRHSANMEMLLHHQTP
ncbi:MAG: hypothetical protein HY403_12065 [Elusimicrobia bacterium]|nr:hypothetical protein [Elusimicrobiota bacterium]